MSHTNKSSAMHQDSAQRFWIFQANPNKYRIEESLKLEREEYWNLNQHAKKVDVGDRVLIWICGKEAGVYAVGTVVTEPELMPDSDKGMKYWLASNEGRRVKPRVLVRYDEVFLDNPLLRKYIRCDPALWNLQILRQPRGTNFPVSEEEWFAIRMWLDEV